MRKNFFVILVAVLSLLIFAKALFNMSISSINNENYCSSIVDDNEDDVDRL